MSKKFPQDEFDLVPVSGGRHRRRRTAGDRALEFVTVVGSGAVLAGAGFLALNWNNTPAANLGSNLGTQQQNTVAQNSGGTKGGGVGVSVLDGTKQDGEASKVAHKLLDAGWNIFSAADVVDASYKPASVAKTTIYIQSADLQNKADSLKGDLGDYPVVVSTSYTDPITVVLGKDFK